MIRTHHDDLYLAPSSPGRSGAPPAPDPTVPAPFADGIAGAVLLVAGCLAAVFYLRRRRRTPPPSPEPAPGGRGLEVVRRILAAGDGLDRESVRLIAEEEGLGAEAVDAAIGRWERAGRIRTEPDLLGGDLLVWSSPAPRGAEEGPGGS